MRKKANPGRYLDGRDLWERSNFNYFYRQWENTGDDKIKERLLFSQEGLVKKIASRQKYISENHLEFDDLINSGFKGLLTGFPNYDPDRGFHPSTFFSWWIKQGIKREIEDNEKQIRIPNIMQGQIYFLKGYVNNFVIEKEREPTIEEISKYSGYNVEKIERILGSSYTLSSLDKLLEKSDSNPNIRKFQWLLRDSESDYHAERMDDKIVSDEIRGVIEEIPMSERERDIIKRRFGMEGQKEMTLGELGNLYNITRERIRQIQLKAMKKIRENEKIQRLWKELNNGYE